MTKDEDRRTTLNIRVGTKQRLHDIGAHEESFDDILNRILDEAEART